MARVYDILQVEWNSAATDAFFDTDPVPPPLLEALPDDYLAVARDFGGREGFLGTQYLRLHRLDELAALNSAYDVPSAVPELVVFGSDGAIEAFAFDLHELTVVQIPFIPMRPEYAKSIARSFTEFIASMRVTGSPLDSDPATLGMQIHCKHPIALGGSPTDEENRVVVPPREHAKIVQFWNKVYDDARPHNAMREDEA